jgi:hypothetical protein
MYELSDVSRLDGRWHADWYGYRGARHRSAGRGNCQSHAVMRMAGDAYILGVLSTRRLGRKDQVRGNNKIWRDDIWLGRQRIKHLPRPRDERGRTAGL